MGISAEDWLEDYLSDGKFHELKKLQADAKIHGFVRRDLREARKVVGVLTEQRTGEVPGIEIWGWRLKKCWKEI